MKRKPQKVESVNIMEKRLIYEIKFSFLEEGAPQERVVEVDEQKTTRKSCYTDRILKIRKRRILLNINKKFNV